ncbi:LolA family protein [Tropicimonas sp.]|uniref:LolA family protein n=1 Tax=Tropicimonas sp. TaxID=2067044 RepID=UPI003A8577FE
MKPLRIFLSAALVAVSVLPAPAAGISLAALSSYMNSFQTATGEFTQINADGTISTGNIYIKRPGRIRFEYNPPDRSLVVAGGGTVAIFDSKSNTAPEQFPLRQTPLGIILQKSVDLTRSDMVTGHGSDGPRTFVVAQDPEHPEYGNIRLVFSDNPVELRQWVVTDSAGERTTVVLGELKKGGDLGAGLFSIQQEIKRR